ncbi:DUF488 domain-containing protein [Oceanobacillus halophilus]|uniref:DUF488 domain-containing protein n=1 Tax=Oceanobacillus halophilus TaxID=930130 RepID=A0A494ZXP3_9BACI|nr:DUF488 domain-containing protein [Oceanobacillus halophilus]RKQ31513.1 DUF488 domain-containing protein [Oceanobacillus halophilus]
MPVKIKRIYEDVDKNDGVRILVDRIWPRGMSKEKANIDYWLKQIAPTTDLRKWFNHDPEKFDEFKEKYIQELESGKQKEELIKLKDIVKANQTITLLYAAKDKKHNQAIILQEIIEDEL